VDRVDCAVDPGTGLCRILGHQLGEVLEREAHRVEALDDAVVQILADALALRDHGQALQLVVHPRTAHGDAGVQGERLDQACVVVTELGNSFLLGEIEVADRPAFDLDGDAEEAVHRRVVRRKAGAPRVRHHVRDTHRAVLADDDAEQPPATGIGADRVDGGLIHAAGDEALHDALVVDDSQRGVARAHQRPHAVDDQLKDTVERRLRRDRPRGGIQRVGDRSERRGRRGRQ